MKTIVEEAREFADMTRRKRDLQSQVDTLTELLTAKEEALLTRFGDEGLESVKIKLGKEAFTLFPLRQLWASAVPGQEKKLFSLLRRNHYGDLIKEKVNTQSLSALIREIDKDGKNLPPAWQKVVKVTEKFRVATRKAT
jgi:hypothetical protein